MKPKYLKILFFIPLFIVSRYLGGPAERYIFPLMLLYFVLLNFYELRRTKISESKALIYSLFIINTGFAVFAGLQIAWQLFGFNLSLGLLFAGVFLQMGLVYPSLKDNNFTS